MAQQQWQYEGQSYEQGNEHRGHEHDGDLDLPVDNDGEGLAVVVHDGEPWEIIGLHGTEHHAGIHHREHVACIEQSQVAQ